jgi:hypothetical protein
MAKRLIMGRASTTPCDSPSSRAPARVRLAAPHSTAEGVGGGGGGGGGGRCGSGGGGGVLREMMLAFKSVEEYHDLPSKDILLCSDPPIRSTKDLIPATVPCQRQAGGEGEGSMIMILRPCWHPPLPTRCDYHLYLAGRSCMTRY